MATTDQASPGPALSRNQRLTLALLVLAAVAVALAAEDLTPEALPRLGASLQTFVTIFLGIFIEAVPFLLLGSIFSGFIAVFVDQKSLARLIPRQPILAALAGGLLGLGFPVCECGVVPVTRRLYQKGLPLSAGIAFLLAAPVVNPIVIASTYAAFGWGPMLLGRLGLSFLIASAVGLFFHFAKPEGVLLPRTMQEGGGHDAGRESAPGAGDRLRQSLVAAGDDFLDTVRYLIVGSALAAAMQTAVPQSALLAIGRGPAASVIALLALAFVLSVCSTVDAFLALAFVKTFTSGSILGFLVFGPMVDIKSSLMFLTVFRRRAVAALIFLPLALTLIAALLVNAYGGL